MSLFLPWLKSNKSMGLSMTLLSMKACAEDRCESMSNLKIAREAIGLTGGLSIRGPIAIDDDRPPASCPGPITGFRIFCRIARRRSLAHAGRSRRFRVVFMVVAGVAGCQMLYRARPSTIPSR
ncbi:MAG: hypothetical protein IPL61_12090 [Myxococcales bacterium]|nr:hypothetical protein [Myxococcales bacterium]